MNPNNQDTRAMNHLSSLLGDFNDFFTENNPDDDYLASLVQKDIKYARKMRKELDDRIMFYGDDLEMDEEHSEEWITLMNVNEDISDLTSSYKEAKKYIWERYSEYIEKVKNEDVKELLLNQSTDWAETLQYLQSSQKQA